MAMQLIVELLTQEKSTVTLGEVSSLAILELKINCKHKGRSFVRENSEGM